MNNIFDGIVLLIVLTAIFTYINHRFIKLPTTIGVMLIALLCSLGIVIVEHFLPISLHQVTAAVEALDFPEFLMQGILSFLLFAGAYQLDLRSLKREYASVLLFSTIGVILSTLTVGWMMYELLALLKLSIPFIYCLLFGSLISPTDPIAVLAILKKAGIPKNLETNISGESLFNDGVAVVIFLSIYEIAGKGVESITISNIGLLFLEEAAGGIILGLSLAYLGNYLLKTVEEYSVGIMITLAIVLGGYALADMIHFSGPLAMVIAGLFINFRHNELSKKLEKHIGIFWESIDEILNAILFLFIGLEILVINYMGSYILVGVSAILIVLFSRVISVSFSILFTKLRRSDAIRKIWILSWGGLRGGISIALALSLSDQMYREEIVAITYTVVIFSILVQGLTIGALVRKLKVVHST